MPYKFEKARPITKHYCRHCSRSANEGNSKDKHIATVVLELSTIPSSVVGSFQAGVLKKFGRWYSQRGPCPESPR